MIHPHILLVLLTTMTHFVTSRHVYLGDGVSLTWTVNPPNDDDDSSLVVKMKVELPEPYRWLAVGFHGIPYKGESWEDIALIAIIKDHRRKERSYLKVNYSHPP